MMKQIANTGQIGLYKNKSPSSSALTDNQHK